MITYYDFVKTITLTSSRSDFYKVCELYPYIESSIRKVIEMGFDPFAPKIFDATVVVCTLSNETLEERVNIYKTLGFDVRDVWEMFKKCPTFLNISEKKITQTWINGYFHWKEEKKWIVYVTCSLPFSCNLMWLQLQDALIHPWRSIFLLYSQHLQKILIQGKVNNYSLTIGNSWEL